MPHPRLAGHLLLNSASGYFTVKAVRDSMSMQTAATGGIVLDTCKSVTLKGNAILTYQMDQYPYAQGTLLNVTQDQLNLTVQASAPWT